MVTKKTNKISQKDINLLLNKLINIIRKISISCGNKNKQLEKKVIRGGLFGFDTKKIDVKDKIAEFINIDYSASDRYFDSFKLSNLPLSISNHINIKESYLNPDKIMRTDYVTFNTHKEVDISKIIDKNSNVIKENIKKSNKTVFYNNTLYYMNDNNTINAMTIHQPDKDDAQIKDSEDILKLHYKYFMLNKNIFNAFSNKTEYTLSNDEYSTLNEIFTKYMKEKKGNTIHDIYKAMKNVQDFIDKRKEDKNNNYHKIDSYLELDKYIKDTEFKRFMKHAAIYNIGLTMLAIKRILD